MSAACAKYGYGVIPVVFCTLNAIYLANKNKL